MVGRGEESPEVSPVRKGTPTVSVPYLIRPKLESDTVSTDSGSWDVVQERTREVMSNPSLPSRSVDLLKLLSLPFLLVLNT